MQQLRRGREAVRNRRNETAEEIQQGQRGQKKWILRETCSMGVDEEKWKWAQCQSDVELEKNREANCCCSQRCTTARRAGPWLSTFYTHLCPITANGWCAYSKHRGTKSCGLELLFASNKKQRRLRDLNYHWKLLRQNICTNKTYPGHRRVCGNP